MTPNPPPSVSDEELIVNAIEKELRRYQFGHGDPADDGGPDILDAIAHWRGDKTVKEAVEHLETVSAYAAHTVLEALASRLSTRRGEEERLRRALEPFAERAQFWDGGRDARGVDSDSTVCLSDAAGTLPCQWDLTIGDFERADQALSPLPEPSPNVGGER